jgi:hypothetical protein
VVDVTARDKYRLQVTAGPSYDTSTHTEVAVNSGQAHLIENDLMSCWLNVRVKDYNGLPHNSPVTSDYFQHPLHTSDRYSIGFSFVPKRNIKGSTPSWLPVRDEDRHNNSRSGCLLGSVLG